MGLTIASAIFQSLTFPRLKTVLAEAGTGYPDSEIQAALAGARSHLLETADPELRARCIDVIVRSIQTDWVLCIAAGALYTICACFLTRKRFLKEEQDAPLQGRELAAE